MFEQSSHLRVSRAGSRSKTESQQHGHRLAAMKGNYMVTGDWNNVELILHDKLLTQSFAD